MNAPPNTWTILGAAGQLGAALVERFLAKGAGPEDRFVLVDRDSAGLARLVGALGSHASRVETIAAELSEWDAAATMAGSFAVVDASVAQGEVRQSLARSALNAGAHWVDFSEDRGGTRDLAELDELAKGAERLVLSSAGLHCALTAPFVRELADGLIRTNEVLIGIYRDPAQTGASTVAGWLERFGQRPRLLIGGEWSERDPFGDRRRFPHPGDQADVFAENLDVPEHELFTDRPYRAASVRVSLSMPSFLERRALHRAGNRVAEGKVPALRAASRLARFSRLVGRGGRPTRVTLIVRGTDPDRLPRERRLSFQTPAGSRELDVVPASLCLARLARGAAGEPGARPALEALETAELEAELGSAGVSITRGDLAGWRSPSA